MALFFVVGLAGAGKTTVCREFKARNLLAYDIDEDGLARWRNNDTGYIWPKSSVKKHMRTAQFITEHSWVVPPQEVTRLTDEAGDKPIYIFGATSNLDELRHLAKGTVALWVGSLVTAERLASRPGDNAWGKTPHERDQTLGALAAALEEYRQKDIPIIDASQPVAAVADQIIDITSQL